MDFFVWSIHYLLANSESKNLLLRTQPFGLPIWHTDGPFLASCLSVRPGEREDKTPRRPGDQERPIQSEERQQALRERGRSAGWAKVSKDGRILLGLRCFEFTDFLLEGRLHWSI